MDLPADMALGGSGHADTINSYPTGTACFADFRDHAVRLMKRGGRHCLGGGCEGHSSRLSGESQVPGMLHPRLGSTWEETMIRLLISVALALAIATSAEAMSPAPLHEPGSMITKVRKASQPACWDPNQVRVNGICMDYARHVSRAQHKCISWNEGVCVEYYGTLKPCGPDVRC